MVMMEMMDENSRPVAFLIETEAPSTGQRFRMKTVKLVAVSAVRPHGNSVLGPPN